MQEYTKWLVLLPLVLSLVKLAQWMRAQVRDQLGQWINTLIDTKVKARSDRADVEHGDLKKLIEDVDFKLREELQAHTLKLAEMETDMKDRERRLTIQETRMAPIWGMVERNAAALLRDRLDEKE